MFQPQALLRPEIVLIEEYTPIQPFEVLSQRLGIPPGEIIKLDANENPYGPIPAVAQALAKYPYYHIYPDPQQTALREALSDFVGVPAAHILPSHGADELLDYLCRLFLQPDDSVINCPPTFGMYSFDAKLAGATVVDLWRRDDFGVDVDKVVGTVSRSMDASSGAKPKILFLTSPNNPSGTWLADADLHRMLELPILVVLDEAYVEFADHESRASWVLEHDNLIVLRTFSKAAGIAGLRLGYGICPEWLMAQLWKFKQPYNVNVAASVAGLASLRHMDQINDVVGKLKAERDRLFLALQDVAFLEPHPSEANFILCNVRSCRGVDLQKALETQGILVRVYNKPKLENCIRISVGRPEQTDRLLTVLKEIRF